MAVERWDSSNEEAEGHVSSRFLEGHTDGKSRFCFHHYLFTPLKKGMLCPNSAHHRWLTHDHPCVRVQISASEACKNISFLHPPLYRYHLLSETAVLEGLYWKTADKQLPSESKGQLFLNKKCLFANYSKLTRGFIYTYFWICDSRQGLPEETQTEDISGKCAFMKLLEWWAIEHDSRLDWDLDSPSTAAHLGDEVLERSEIWIFLLGNIFPGIIV